VTSLVRHVTTGQHGQILGDDVAPIRSTSATELNLDRIAPTFATAWSRLGTNVGFSPFFITRQNARLGDALRMPAAHQRLYNSK